MAIDVSFILLYATGVLGSGVTVCWLIFHVPFHPYTTAVISVEQVCLYWPHVCVCVNMSVMVLCLQLRFAMKSYSFIRENAYKVIYPWNKDDTSGMFWWRMAHSGVKLNITYWHVI